MLEMSWWFAGLLLSTGVIAGVINTLAGGGSNLTLPALMVMGMPPDVANATNRIGVFAQSVVGVKAFDQHDMLARGDIWPILWPTLIGAALGSGLASYMPGALLKPLLLGAMLSMALIILLKPGVVSPPTGVKPYKVAERPSAWWVLLAAGFYGGFVQAGVGFILIAALAGSLRYDLMRTNALKMLCTGLFTLVALVIFIARGQVEWIPGLVLALGTMVGARLGVSFALQVSQKTLKWFLFLMTLVGCGAALLW
jgi:uncharacterized membrane protein YfcA